MRRLYDKFGWPTGIEKKWSTMSGKERLAFASGATNLSNKESQIRFRSITVKKRNVANNIRQDPNKLYNYMTRLLLAKEMAAFEKVLFMPDERSVKVASGNSLHDYLQIHLWFELDAETELTTIPLDSSATLNLQFADMLAGAVQSHYERKKSAPRRMLGEQIVCTELFF